MLSSSSRKLKRVVKACVYRMEVITVLAADHSLQHEDEILVSEHLREVVCQIEQRSFVDSLTQQKHCVICVDLVHRLL